MGKPEYVCHGGDCPACRAAEKSREIQDKINAAGIATDEDEAALNYCLLQILCNSSTYVPE